MPVITYNFKNILLSYEQIKRKIQNVDLGPDMPRAPYFEHKKHFPPKMGFVPNVTQYVRKNEKIFRKQSYTR